MCSLFRSLEAIDCKEPLSSSFIAEILTGSASFLIKFVDEHAVFFISGSASFLIKISSAAASMSVAEQIGPTYKFEGIVLSLAW